MSKRKIKIALSATLGMSALLVTACGTEPGSGGTANNEPIVKTEPAKAPSDKGDQVVTGGDLAFMNEAAPGGMAEVELGRLAAKLGASNDVKKFGQQMVIDHSKANQELMQLAQGKRVTLPQELLPKHKETMERLSKLKGAEFDRAYIMAMVEDHEKDVTAFNAAATGGTDADVKAFAAKTLPTLRMHLQMIREIEGKMK